MSIVDSRPGGSCLPAPDELVLLVRAVAERGDRQAFATLFKVLAPRVKSYLVRCGAADDLAEELAQETMVTLWRKAALFDPERARLSTWVFTIARNLRVDALRRQPGLHLADDVGCDLEALPNEHPRPDEVVYATRMGGAVRAAIARLPAEQAEVLRLSYYDEQPHSQIARRLEIPLGTVKSRLRLAVAQVRRLLNEEA